MDAGYNTVGLNAVIDLSHWNGGPLDFAKARAAGIRAVIHKATQGVTVRDPMYIHNKHRALDAGLLWGAYHFGTNEPGRHQAEYFLEYVRPDNHTVLVLDYEPNYSAQSTMGLGDATEFVETVAGNVDRFPGLYSGHLIKNQLLGKAKHPILSQCWLWIAQYGPRPNSIPATWTTWTLWQYTDGAAGPAPHLVEGIGYCDRNVFNGDLAGLRRLWGY